MERRPQLPNPDEGDQLSSLHDEIIIKILSLLPLQSAITTGALSRRWRGLWKGITSIDLTTPSFFGRDLNAIVNNLSSLRLPCAKKLRLVFPSSHTRLVKKLTKHTCPSLEDLYVVFTTNWAGPPQRGIVVYVLGQSLRRISVNFSCARSGWKSVNINAPKLEYLSLYATDCISYCLSVAPMACFEVEIFSETYNLAHFRAFSNVKSLTLSSSALEAMKGFADAGELSRFCNLTNLKLRLHCPADGRLLLHLLKFFPSLEVMDLNFYLYLPNKTGLNPLDDHVPLQLCPLTCLKRINIGIGTSLRKEPQAIIELVSYIFRNANNLELLVLKAAAIPNGTEQEEQEQVQQEIELICEQIYSCQISSCQISSMQCKIKYVIE